MLVSTVRDDDETQLRTELRMILPSEGLPSAAADVLMHVRHAPVESTSGEAVSQTVGRLPGLHQNKHLRMDLWASRKTAGRVCICMN